MNLRTTKTMGTPSSNKSKGRTGQQEVQKLLLRHFPELEHDDCRSNPMGSDGEDILLSPAARKILPWNIEVKRKKSVGAARFMEQCDDHGKWEPVCFFREDKRKGPIVPTIQGEWFVVVRASYLLELMKDD